MPPKKPKLRENELFRMQLTNMIDMDHPLVKVAQLIDWSQFDEGFGRFLHAPGASWVADASTGRAAPLEAYGRPVRRGGLQALGREPILPVLLRRTVFQAQTAAGSLIDDALARADRAGEAGVAVGPDVGRRHADERGDTASL